MTPLALLNFLVLQWLCIRLAYVKDDEGATIGWGLLGFVAPLTGWWSDYVWLRRPDPDGMLATWWLPSPTWHLRADRALRWQRDPDIATWMPTARDVRAARILAAHNQHGRLIDTQWLHARAEPRLHVAAHTEPVVAYVELTHPEDAWFRMYIRLDEARPLQRAWDSDADPHAQAAERMLGIPFDGTIGVGEEAGA